jgi:hypothetical protein
MRIASDRARRGWPAKFAVIALQAIAAINPSGSSAATNARMAAVTKTIGRQRMASNAAPGRSGPRRQASSAISVPSATSAMAIARGT